MEKVGYFKFIILVIICVASNHASERSRIRFTNMICNCTDPLYGHINKCGLKAVSRNVQYFTAKVTMFHVPITDFEIRVQLMIRYNGWQPYLYDQTIRCNFTRNGNYLTKRIWKLARNVSNVKTDCPYTQQVFDLPRLENTFVDDALKKLPLPSGKYGVFATVKTYNKTRGWISFQATVL